MKLKAKCLVQVFYSANYSKKYSSMFEAQSKITYCRRSWEAV